MDYDDFFSVLPEKYFQRSTSKYSISTALLRMQWSAETTMLSVHF